VNGNAVYKLSATNKDLECLGWLDEYHVALLWRIDNLPAELVVFDVGPDFESDVVVLELNSISNPTVMFGGKVVERAEDTIRILEWANSDFSTGREFQIAPFQNLGCIPLITFHPISRNRVLVSFPGQDTMLDGRILNIETGAWGRIPATKYACRDFNTSQANQFEGDRRFGWRLLRSNYRDMVIRYDFERILSLAEHATVAWSRRALNLLPDDNLKNVFAVAAQKMWN
jgi:hypothetical protein